MRIFYDLHIHSALSPCADNGMTPTNIVAYATVSGLNAICIADHNSIKNVATATEIGNFLGITVVPGVEIQTEEEIHVLALFKTISELEGFYDKLSFPFIKNEEKIFGEQLIFDTDDNVVGREERLLSVSADIGIYPLCDLILASGGLAIAAHIDREANGILAILGELPPDIPFSAIEFSPYASEELRNKYSGYKQLTNSDAHYIDNISKPVNFLECSELSVEAIFSSILA